MITTAFNKYIMPLLVIALTASILFLFQKNFVFKEEIDFLKKELQSHKAQIELINKSSRDKTAVQRPSGGIDIPHDYKKLIQQFLERDINSIITEEHLAGGNWIVTDYRFLSPDTILINYEDGHMAGQALLKIDFANRKKVKGHIIWRLE